MGGGASSKPKLIQLITQAEFGGAQKYVYDVALALRDEYDVIVAAGELDKSDELLSRLSEQGVRTIKLRRVKRRISPFVDIPGFRELVRLINHERPDIVHLNATKMSVLGSLACMYVSRRARSSASPYEPLVVYTAHGWVFTEKISRFRRWFYTYAEHLTSRLKDVIVVLSHVDKELAHEHNIFPRKRIIVIPNGVDIPQREFIAQAPARHELVRFARSVHCPSEVNPRAFIVGTVANLYPNKGLKHLIDACAMVREQLRETGFDRPFQALIIGDGELKSQLLKRIDEQGLDDTVLLLGRVKDAWRYMRAFDVFVLPSLKEGVPFVLLEAMNARVPIIASDVGAIGEIVTHKRHALLIPPADPQILAEHIHEIMHHPDVAERISDAAYERARSRFTSRAMVEQLIEVYQSH